jgi:predicted DNA-binding transcriptional regulator AlpA
MDPTSSEPADKKAQSITQFCASHGISRSMFYKIEKLGQAPRMMRVGTRRLVSDEAALDWRRAREAEADAPTRGDTRPSSSKRGEGR